MRKYFLFILGLISAHAVGAATSAAQDQRVVMQLRASTKEERTQIVQQGMTIEEVHDDSVLVLGRREQAHLMQTQGKLISVQSLARFVRDFPAEDQDYHNYAEMVAELQALQTSHSDISELFSMGPSIEGREMLGIRIGPADGNLPAVLFVGGHHAREHLSVEVPLLLAKHLLEQRAAGNTDVARLVESRQIFIMPMTNPDGAEFDMAAGQYEWWRKNRRRNEGGSFGVDLNRNYGFKWGTGGSSNNPNDETYMGTAPFSEPETQNVKTFVEAHPNISILLSLHTFSELILYPWGHSYDSISSQTDLQVFETMAKTMAKWNKYRPQQSSDLYIASGDTTDWAYGEHGIFAFTFELDPKMIFFGGFYPGAGVIQKVFQKNLQPCLYLIDLADNPYRAITKPYENFGLNTPLISVNSPSLVSPIEE